MEKLSKINLPLICFKDGSPPIPDISDSYLDSSCMFHSFHTVNCCYV